MTVTAAPPTTPQRRRWPWVLLVASLALNALLAGVIVRGLWTMRGQAIMAGGGIESALPSFVATLPPNRREELYKHSRPDRIGAFRPLRAELRRARAEAARAFAADPYDKQAFIAAQARVFEAETNLRTAIQRLLPEIGEHMTPVERRAYIQWRVWGGGGGGGGPRRGSSGGPGSRGGERGDDPGWRHQ